MRCSFGGAGRAEGAVDHDPPRLHHGRRQSDGTVWCHGNRTHEHDGDLVGEQRQRRQFDLRNDHDAAVCTPRPPTIPANGITISALGSDGKTSAIVYVAVEPAGPSISSISPNPIPVGSYTITVTGNGLQERRDRQNPRRQPHHHLRQLDYANDGRLSGRGRDRRVPGRESRNACGVRPSTRRLWRRVDRLRTQDHFANFGDGETGRHATIHFFGSHKLDRNRREHQAQRPVHGSRDACRRRARSPSTCRQGPGGSASAAVTLQVLESADHLAADDFLEPRRDAAVHFGRRDGLGRDVRNRHDCRPLHRSLGDVVHGNRYRYGDRTERKRHRDRHLDSARLP